MLEPVSEEFMKEFNEMQDRYEEFSREVWNQTPVGVAMKHTGLSEGHAVSVLISAIVSHYSILIRYDAATDEYVATVPELLGECMARSKSHDMVLQILVQKMNAYCIHTVKAGEIIKLPNELNSNFKKEEK